MHHKAVILSEDNILIVGGRRSPLAPNNVLYLLKLMAGFGEWEVVKLHESSVEMGPRWRHSATKYRLHGELKTCTCSGNYFVHLG